MLMPKRVKRRKQFRGSMRGKATRGNTQVCSNRTDSSPRGVGRFGRWTLEGCL